MQIAEDKHKHKEVTAYQQKIQQLPKNIDELQAQIGRSQKPCLEFNREDLASRKAVETQKQAKVHEAAAYVRLTMYFFA